MAGGGDGVVQTGGGRRQLDRRHLVRVRVGVRVGLGVRDRARARVGL